MVKNQHILLDFDLDFGQKCQKACENVYKRVTVSFIKFQNTRTRTRTCILKRVRVLVHKATLMITVRMKRPVTYQKI